MSDGKIIKSGDADLALYVEKNGYSEILNEKARNDQFFSNLEKFVNKVYPNQPQRQPYLNLKSWPSPRDEAWKFSRLGNLARKNILPLNLKINKISILIN